MEEQELNGTNRVVFDDVIDKETCQKLMVLVKVILSIQRFLLFPLLCTMFQ